MSDIETAVLLICWCATCVLSWIGGYYARVAEEGE